MNWLNNVNTTNLRIVVSLVLAVIYVLVIIGGVMLGKPMQIEALNTLGLFLLGAMGIDAASFIGKRFSDIGYATAKSQPNVNVAAPATVQVGTPSNPVAPPVTPHPTSEKGD